MKLISSVVALVLAGVLSVWLWVGQGSSDTVTDGVAITAGPDANLQKPVPQEVADVAARGPISNEYAAAFVGLQAAMDVWRSTPSGVLGDPELLAGAVTKAQEAVAAELAAAEKARKEEEAAEKARQEESDRRARAVTPAPVSPPDYDYDDDDDDDDDDDWDCEWDDGEWDCDD
ncbi:hypothetical protein [Ornithinimicrobium cryptoxanthini]|uniref:Uncharacterized protein n=1 Tax=Ornithinimicrobium cryptoxanthini TaxID=2934161 RepID=A0ABY4YI07_9MICO|nr:hypothetical protein [Ornithinimicrobium cryptoxanthini]USQ76247.1 hypothetical protein NF557_16920 [Ornithinimicrobium cryptoxanthini]